MAAFTVNAAKLPDTPFFVCSGLAQFSEHPMR